MTTLIEANVSNTGGAPTSVRVKMRMLEQMAEALEDEANGLYRRAAAFEEDEFLLNREIGERQTEINRLLLKLEGLRAERDRVLERIESITHEAKAMREEIFTSEEEIALAGLETGGSTGALAVNGSNDGSKNSHQPTATFFRRMALAE